MVQWQSSAGLTEYEQSLAVMQARAQAIRAGEAEELVWLLEHPPLYTAGTSAKGNDLLDGKRFPVYEAGRGGEYTYHGPGQRIAYVMLDLAQRGKDIRAYVKQLEQWIILTLAEFGIEGFTREGRIGVWINTPCDRLPNSHEPAKAADSIYCSQREQKFVEKKIAALGIRVRKWVSFHGIAINVVPDLSHYAGIVPCGISDFGVTSLADMGVQVSMDEVDAALKQSFTKVFETIP